MRDANGRLSVRMLSENDPEMKDIIENGWVWTIVPYYAEVLWPELPDLAASVLNAEHSTFSMASEVQVMVSLANYQAMNMSMTEAIEKIMTSAPPCHAYLHVLWEFVVNYAGGAGAPILMFLDRFSKKYCGSKVLGNNFIEAVTRATWQTRSTKFPFVRHQLLFFRMAL